jgi:hypothetical protein
MTLDWSAIRLELLQIDASMRASLRMRPFFAKSLPGILARFYDKVGTTILPPRIFNDGAMQDAFAGRCSTGDLIASRDFDAAYASLVARICEFHQNAGVAPQWYVGCAQSRPRFSFRASAAPPRPPRAREDLWRCRRRGRQLNRATVP